MELWTKCKLRCMCFELRDKLQEQIQKWENIPYEDIHSRGRRKSVEKAYKSIIDETQIND